MELDFKFIAKMLSNHLRHLARELSYLEKNLEGYDRQISSIERIGDPVRYGARLKELEEKRTEVLIKISYVKPNMEKINEQLDILEK